MSARAGAVKATALALLLAAAGVLGGCGLPETPEAAAGPAKAAPATGTGLRISGQVDVGVKTRL